MATSIRQQQVIDTCFSWFDDRNHRDANLTFDIFCATVPASHAVPVNQLFRREDRWFRYVRYVVNRTEMARCCAACVAKKSPGRKRHSPDATAHDATSERSGLRGVLVSRWCIIHRWFAAVRGDCSAVFAVFGALSLANAERVIPIIISASLGLKNHAVAL